MSSVLLFIYATFRMRCRDTVDWKILYINFSIWLNIFTSSFLTLKFSIFSFSVHKCYIEYILETQTSNSWPSEMFLIHIRRHSLLDHKSSQLNHWNMIITTRKYKVNKRIRMKCKTEEIVFYRFCHHSWMTKFLKMIKKIF